MSLCKCLFYTAGLGIKELEARPGLETTVHHKKVKWSWTHQRGLRSLFSTSASTRAIRTSFMTSGKWPVKCDALGCVYTAQHYIKSFSYFQCTCIEWLSERWAWNRHTGLLKRTELPRGPMEVRWIAIGLTEVHWVTCIFMEAHWISKNHKKWVK